MDTRHVIAAGALLLGLAGCGGGADEAPKAEPVWGEPSHATWTYLIPQWPGAEERLVDSRAQNGPLDVSVDEGPIYTALAWSPGTASRAEAVVHATADGLTYWVGADSPRPGDGATGLRQTYDQLQRYRKQAGDARLEFVVTQAMLQVIDENGDIILSRECPWLGTEGRDACGDAMLGSLKMWITSHVRENGQWRQVDGRAAFAELYGFSGTFAHTVSGYVEAPSADGGEAGPAALGPVWTDGDFEWQPDLDGTGAQARLRLKAPLRVRVDLSRVPTGAEFIVGVRVQAQAVNRRGRESHVAAFFRDPASGSGIGEVRTEASGLEALGVTERIALPPVPPPGPAPACTEPRADLATLELTRGSYTLAEWPGARQPVIVQRTNGSRGAVSVRLRSVGGSAVVGADYAPLDLHVHFGDGDTVPRVVPLAIVGDAVAEPDKTIELALSEPGGCAAIGVNASAVVRLLDDDRPIEDPVRYDVGGVVSGLGGSGLVIEEIVSGRQVSARGNGAFVFGALGGTGTRYDVRVVVQPQSPAQACTVRNGSGVVGNAHVSDVAVECVTVPPSGSLDPAFGSGGKVIGGAVGPARRVALQPDGRIVVLGAMRLARYLADGTPDPTFGGSGLVTIDFEGPASSDVANALAVQSDGAIVVAGTTSIPRNDGSGISDSLVAVARYHADGTPDMGFGNGGTVSIDPVADLATRGSFARAEGLRPLPDGRLLVWGSNRFTDSAGLPSKTAFVVLRLRSDGTLDAGDPRSGGFAGSGAARILVGSEINIARALAVQADGMLVVGGRAGTNFEVQVGLARLTANGDLDTGDPRLPRYYGRDDTGTSYQVLGSVADFADMVMLPDDSLVVALSLTPDPLDPRTLALATVNRDGGTERLVHVPVGSGNSAATAIARGADGRLVVAGWADSGTVSDFVVARYNADLSPDATFGSGGVLQLDVLGGADSAAALVVAPDGGLIVVGTARDGRSDSFAMVKLRP